MPKFAQSDLMELEEERLCLLFILPKTAMMDRGHKMGN